MTDLEVQQLARQLAATTASLDALSKALGEQQQTQDERMDRLEKQIQSLVQCVSTMSGQRREWERHQGIGSRKKAAIIGSVATVASAIGGGVVTYMMGLV